MVLERTEWRAGEGERVEKSFVGKKNASFCDYVRFVYSNALDSYNEDLKGPLREACGCVICR